MPIVADRITKKVFSVLKKIIYFGEKSYAATNYKKLTAAFIGSNKKLQNDFPNDSLGWEAHVEGSIKQQSENLLKIEIDHYTYTSGALGDQGLHSLLFDPNSGAAVSNTDLFKDQVVFTAFTEKNFGKIQNTDDEINQFKGLFLKTKSFFSHKTYSLLTKACYCITTYTN